MPAADPSRRPDEPHPVAAPDPAAIQAAHRALQPFVRETPAWRWTGHRLARRVDPATAVTLKLELLQHTGSFKPRGALCVMQALSAEELARGVTAVSAGNHAMAVAYAAGVLGSHAVVAMPQSADPSRVQACRDLGAEVVTCPDIAAAFATAEQLQRDQGRAMVHPFEGPRTALGTATLGYEFLRQTGQLDAIVVPIGGGGLCAGVAAAVKQLQPRCRVYGVEPAGADSMHRSFAAGSPQRIPAVTTIADSLGAPYALPYSFALCRRFVDELVRVDDDELRRAMALLFADAKLAVEPAGAAATAALLQRADELQGRRVGVVVCGANVAPEVFADCLLRGRAGVL
ncbi:MAG: threonine/serine dehydratase [Planctomycetota bacterium]